jgi:hypothetical protein
MTSRIGLVLLVGLAAAAACHRPSKEDRDICDRAATRYVTCVGEILGPEAQRIASSPEKDGRDACARDEKTIDLYRTCLPKTACDEFMDCLTGYAEATAPRE